MRWGQEIPESLHPDHKHQSWKPNEIPKVENNPTQKNFLTLYRDSSQQSLVQKLSKCDQLHTWIWRWQSRWCTSAMPPWPFFRTRGRNFLNGGIGGLGDESSIGMWRRGWRDRRRGNGIAEEEGNVLIKAGCALISGGLTCHCGYQQV